MNSAAALFRYVHARPGLALLIFVWLMSLAFASQEIHLVPIWRRDFLNYWLGPRALWAGVNPYDVTAYAHYGLTYFPQGGLKQFNFTYPPHALFLFAPFAVLPPNMAFVAWDIVSLAAFYLAARPLLPKGLPALPAVLSFATLICLQFGQTGLLSSALFLTAARGSGIAAAVLTFKPHLGFLAAPALLLKGRKRFLQAIAYTIVIIVVSEAVLGHWRDFLEHAWGYQGNQIFDESYKDVWYLMGVTPSIGYGVTGFVLYGVGAAIVLSRNFNIFTAATATFLISPYGLHYDMSAVCLGFAILIFSHAAEMPLWHKVVAALAYLSPVLVQFGTWWVPPILLLGLFVQTQWFPGVRLTVRERGIAVVDV